MEMEPKDANDTVVLRCVKEKGKLRIKIVSPGYAQDANCQFPRDIRVEGREYLVPRCDVTMADMKGKFFYRIKKTNIKVVDQKFTLKVYGDENPSECPVCLRGTDEVPAMRFVILVRCGHYALCAACADGCKNSTGSCPLCRAPIEQIITKDQLQT
jgi:hypothetical protein